LQEEAKARVAEREGGIGALNDLCTVQIASKRAANSGGLEDIAWTESR
jgi:hypothetical protein